MVIHYPFDAAPCWGALEHWVTLSAALKKPRAMTLYLILLGVGAAAGASLGWKLGRGYERVRPKTKPKTALKAGSKTKKKKKTR